MRIAAVSELPIIADLKLKMFQEVGMEGILMDGFIDEVIRSYKSLRVATCQVSIYMQRAGHTSYCTSGQDGSGRNGGD